MRLHRPPCATLIPVVWASLVISCAGDEGAGPNESVATVTVTPPSSMIAPAEALQLEATAKDATGAPLTGRTITWSSSNSDMAMVAPAGIVTGVAPGSATITATSEGRSVTAAITVALLGEACPDLGAPGHRCARVVGTVRDSEGLPVMGASVGAIRAPGLIFIQRDPVETDANGRFDLEVVIALSGDHPATDTFPAYVRATLDLVGDAAVDTSALVQMVFAFPATRPPVQTTDLVIDRSQALPAPTRRIVFVHHPDFQTADLYVIHADGSGRRQLLVNPRTDVEPTWTPDGQAVLFTTVSSDGLQTRLWLIDVDGSHLRPFGADLSGSSPRWAPDGKHVAFLAGYTDEAGRPHRAGLWVANPDGTEPYRLPTQDDQLCEGIYCAEIVSEDVGAGLFFEWYPDADRISYAVAIQSNVGERRGFYTTRLSDSTIAPIVGPFPIWAPDGSRFLVLHFGLIQIMAHDGTPLAAIPVGSGSITFSASRLVTRR